MPKKTGLEEMNIEDHKTTAYLVLAEEELLKPLSLPTDSPDALGKYQQLNLDYHKTFEDILLNYLDNAQ